MRNEEQTTTICREEKLPDRQSLERLCQEHQGFVRKRAWRWVSTDGSNHRRDFDDLLQWGFLGLLEAAKRYQPEKGASFLTYAAWWIDRSIRRGLSNGHTQPDMIDRALSLDEALPGDENGACLLELQADPLAPNPADLAQAADMRRIVRRKVEELPEEQGEVIEAYYFRGETLQKIADAKGWENTRVRRLREKALQKMSRDIEIRQLRESFCFGRKTLAAFRRDWTSVVEEAAIRRDKYR